MRRASSYRGGGIAQETIFYLGWAHSWIKRMLHSADDGDIYPEIMDRISGKRSISMALDKLSFENLFFLFFFLSIWREPFGK